MAAGERAPVVGTNTLIATPSADGRWCAGADARVSPWNGARLDRHEPGSGPAAIALVNNTESLLAALSCGVAVVWAEAAVDPDAAVDALSRGTAQLILEVAGPGTEADLIGLARLGAAHHLAPGRLAMALRAEPRVDIPAVLGSWGADALLRSHPLIVVVTTATPPATRAGLIAAAAIAGAAVATDDVRGARRVIEVLGAIGQHRTDDEGELR